MPPITYIFITHHHSDHNLEYGSLMYNAWASGFKGQIDTYGPPPIQKITDLFLETNAYDINIRIPDEGRSPLKPANSLTLVRKVQSLDGLFSVHSDYTHLPESNKTSTSMKMLFFKWKAVPRLARNKIDFMLESRVLLRV